MSIRKKRRKKYNISFSTWFLLYLLLFLLLIGLLISVGAILVFGLFLICCIKLLCIALNFLWPYVRRFIVKLGQTAYSVFTEFRKHNYKPENTPNSETYEELALVLSDSIYATVDTSDTPNVPLDLVCEDGVTADSVTIDEVAVSKISENEITVGEAVANEVAVVETTSCNEHIQKSDMTAPQNTVPHHTEPAVEEQIISKKRKHTDSDILLYAAMCEKHAQEQDYMEKLGILDDYQNEM